MTLWIILTSMTAIVAAWAAIPFLRGDGGADGASEVVDGSAVYRDQLRQIASDLNAGTISEAEAEAMRTDVAHRLVVAERKEKTRAEPARIADHRLVAVGISAAVAVGSAILYARIGEPERIPAVRATGEAPGGSMGSAPARHPAISSNSARARSQASDSAEGRSGEQGGLPTVEGMIERLAQRLKANPDDADGWRTLGWSYASQGRLYEAAAAYQEASKRQPENGDLYGARGEILVRAGNGFVSPEAASLFEEALKRDNQNPRARFFLGLKKDQEGNRVGALDDWIAILQGASPSEPWARDLREHVEQLAAELKVDLTNRLPSGLPAVPPPVQVGGRGSGILGALQGERAAGPAATTADADRSKEPAAGEARTAAAAGQEDQMIRNMVDGLASRLEKQPRDLEGWSRLIRSRKVLGEVDKAKTALSKAREIFADAPDALATIGATARELGLEP